MKTFYSFLLCVAVMATCFAQQKQTTQAQRNAYEDCINTHNFSTRKHLTTKEIKAIPKKDRPDLAWEQNFLETMDPNTGKPEPTRLYPVFEQIKAMQNNLTQSVPGLASAPWVERGPNNVGGRTRAVAWDPTIDFKVWAGGVAGGLWYNNDITANGSWVAVDDFWDNIAITAIAFDPNNSAIMYVGTGEGFGLATSRGAGVWKSVDSGASWIQLASTTNFYYVNDIVVRNNGGVSEVFVATGASEYLGQVHGNSGLQKSINGGETWAQLMPNAGGSAIEPADLEIAADNTIWLGTNVNASDAGAGRIYSSTDGTTFNLRHTNAATGRVKIACAPSNADYVYAIFESARMVNAVKRTTDGGLTWTARVEPADDDVDIPNTDFTRGQARYDLSMAVDPNNEETLVVGGIDLFKSTDGMATWTQISHWYGGFNHQQLHADQHTAVYKNGSSNDILFGNDGGMAYTGNGLEAVPEIVAKNNGYNVTQYYAGAIHPNAGSNIFLAGAQDNGTQRYFEAGINSTSEVFGGDGTYCHIDQTNGLFQIAAFVFNEIGRSINAGVSFDESLISDYTTGKFINPTDLDDNLNILYTYATPTQLYKITGIETATNATLVNLPSSLGTSAGCLKVSPYETASTTLYVGTDAGKLFKITTMNTAPVITEITGASFPTGSISCIEFGATENDIIVTFKNYGVTSVWLTTDGGTTWFNKEGDLPDLPVRWALINPNNTNEVILATEVGVWSTTNISVPSPTWVPSNSGLANVRVDMLQTRTSDNEVIAVTHGRGLFSSSGFNGATPLDVDFAADQTNVNVDQIVTLSNMSNLDTDSWSWTITPSTFNYVAGTNANSENPQVVFTVNDTYSVTLEATVGLDSDTEVKLNYITAEIPAYCVSTATSNSDSQIDRVELNTINNASVDVCASYSDFTAISTDLTIGATYPLKVETASCSGTTYDRATTVWIDWNHDFDFDDGGEKVASSTLANSAIETLVQNITVPASAAVGATRMRVSCKEDMPSTACEIFGYGEVEDYTINISASNASTSEEIANQSIKLFPNPSNGNVNIYLSDKKNTQVKVFTLSGKEVYFNRFIEKSKLNFNLEVENGVYLVVVKVDNASKIFKLIID